MRKYDLDSNSQDAVISEFLQIILVTAPGAGEGDEGAVGFALLHTPLHTEAAFWPPAPANA